MQKIETFCDICGGKCKNSVALTFPKWKKIEVFGTSSNISLGTLGSEICYERIDICIDCIKKLADMVKDLEED